MQTINFFRIMATWGIWDIISLAIALIPSLLVIVYIFPRKRIDNLYIDTCVKSVNTTYPKVVSIALRNHTNEPLYILSQGFTFGNAVHPSPYGAKDASTGVYEIKFEGRQQGSLTEIDTLVRPNQIVTTWIPIDPNQSNQVVSDALRNRAVGTLRLRCQSVSQRPHPFTVLKIPL